MPDEVDQDETKEIDLWLKDHDITRVWIQVWPHPGAELLEILPEVVEDIRIDVESGNSVFLHRYLLSPPYN